MDQVFINETFTKAIDDYLNNKNDPEGVIYNSFLVVVIRMLVLIYSELDIINPLMTDNEKALKENLIKFEYPLEAVEKFFIDLQKYDEIENKNQNNDIKIANSYFISIQKQLVDMLIKKKLNFHLTEREVLDFYDLLYTPHTKNTLRLSYNYLTSQNISEVDEYFRRELKENVKIIKAQDKEILNVKAYEILNYLMDDIYKMDNDELTKINHQVYDYFQIRENAINKEYLLEQALLNLEREKNKLTTGNGYVDILLIMGVISTAILIISIILYKVL